MSLIECALLTVEGSLLSTHIFGAVKNIPSCFKKMHELLSTTKQDNPAALEVLEEIRNYLAVFKDVAIWLEETKRLHELLQTLDQWIEPIRSQCSIAYQNGIFDFDSFPIKNVRQPWIIARDNPLKKILIFAENIDKIGEKLVLDLNSEFVSGPEWAHSLIELKDRINGYFAKYEKGQITVKGLLADCLVSLLAQVREYMFRADEELRKVSGILSNSFIELGGRLHNV